MPNEKETFTAYAGMDLKTIKQAFETIAGSWNGSDEQYLADGEPYHEDHAHAAQEIIEAVDALQTMLNDFVEL